MTTLIPAIGACSSRMTNGERRFAHRLEDKLEDDYLCWYDVSVGERTQRPDFVVFHPGRGLLVLEVKDWKTTTLQSMTMQHAVLLTDHGIKHGLNPLEQARQYLYAVIHKLESKSFSVDDVDFVKALFKDRGMGDAPSFSASSFGYIFNKSYRACIVV